ncbi:hypothetical protein H3V31_gp37 [Escherichia phage ev207]|uniref:Uncharacterized protein n=1 Tax=Escherichia phage ev207 TaxID=2847062 RepID=A0A653FWW8_9CAUD|nr:hypothetical protein H3V31_gp37 [Escherichia phage ev207]VUF53657.1 hypothetical protein [Escherichia phage ev207]
MSRCESLQRYRFAVLLQYATANVIDVFGNCCLTFLISELA